MITEQELQELAHRPPNAGGVLSAYVNVDQSKSINLNRGYETALRTALRQCERAVDAEDERARFRQAAQAVTELVRDHRVAERTLLVVSNGTDAAPGLYRLETSTETLACWASTPYVRPIAEAYDEFERYAVILTDRAQARLYMFCMGEIEDRAQTLAKFDVHRFDASGQDTMWSQMHYQRKQDMHARHHLKSVVEAMERMAEGEEFTRLIVAGPETATAEIQKLLPDHLRKRTIGTLSLPLDAEERAIMKATLDLSRDWERRNEVDVVERLVTAAAKGNRGTTGLNEVLEACITSRIDRLVYADGYEPPEVGKDRALDQIKEMQDLPLDMACSNGAPHNDLLEWLVKQTLRRGGSIEQVREDAAGQLTEKASGIGAFLRF